MDCTQALDDDFGNLYAFDNERKQIKMPLSHEEAAKAVVLLEDERGICYVVQMLRVNFSIIQRTYLRFREPVIYCRGPGSLFHKSMVLHIKVGWLEVGDARHEVYTGENRIGRDASLCQIVIDSKTLSKEHAVIEISSDSTPFIYDLHSLNKTRLGKTVLQPEARYQLLDGSELLFADIKAVYKIVHDGSTEEDIDSGSETGSESMLNISTAEENVIPATPAPVRLKPSIIEETLITNEPEEDKQKTDIECAENSSRAKAAMCINEKQEETNLGDDDIYEADTQADESFFEIESHLKQRAVNSSSKDSLNITDDIFAVDTQCDESNISDEKLNNEKENKSENSTSKKINEIVADQEKIIYEKHNQCVESSNTLNHSVINKFSNEKINSSTNLQSRNNKELSVNNYSHNISENDKSSCIVENITFKEKNALNLEKNNNSHRADEQQNVPGASAQTMNSVKKTEEEIKIESQISESFSDEMKQPGKCEDKSPSPLVKCNINDEDVDNDDICEANTLCIESEFQFLTPMKLSDKNNKTEENENDDISEMMTQRLEPEFLFQNQLKPVKSKSKKKENSRLSSEGDSKNESYENIEEAATQRITPSSEVLTAFQNNDQSREVDEIHHNEKQEASSFLTVKKSSKPSNDYPASPSLLQEDEVLDGSKQKLTDMLYENKEEMKTLNEEKREEKQFEKNNVEPTDLAVDKETCNTIQGNIESNSEDETDSENIFEAHTQLLYKNNETIAHHSENVNGINVNGRPSELNKFEKKNETASLSVSEVRYNEASIKEISKSTKTCAQNSETVEHPLESVSDDDTKSEDLFEMNLQAKDKENKSIDSSSNINNPGFSVSDPEKHAGVLQSNRERSEECKRDTSSAKEEVENDNIYEANTQIFDFNGHSGVSERTNVSENFNSRKDELKNTINSTKKVKIYAQEQNTENTLSAENILENVPKNKKNSAEHDILIQNNAEETNLKSVEETSLTRNKLAEKESIHPIAEEQDIHNIFDAATQIIDEEMTAPHHHYRTSETLDLGQQRAVIKVMENHSNGSLDTLNFSELATQTIEIEPVQISAKHAPRDHINSEKNIKVTETKGKIESKQDNLLILPIKEEKRNEVALPVNKNVVEREHVCNSSEIAVNLHQVNIDSDDSDSLMNAPTQIFIEDIDNKFVSKCGTSNASLHRSANAHCSSNKDEQDFEIKNVQCLTNKTTFPKEQEKIENSVSHSVTNPEPIAVTKLSLGEVQKAVNEMQGQDSPPRSLPKDENTLVSPTLPSNISKHIPVNKRRGNLNSYNELQNNITAPNTDKGRRKKATEIAAKKNENVEDVSHTVVPNTDKYKRKKATEIVAKKNENIMEDVNRTVENNVKTKHSDNQKNQQHNKRKSQQTSSGIEGMACRKSSRHSKNKINVTSDSIQEDTFQSFRPSRQRKMTWKVRESLLNDRQESCDNDTSSRKRNSSSLENSDVEISIPNKSRKQSSSKVEKQSVAVGSASENSNDGLQSKANKRKQKSHNVEESASTHQTNWSIKNTPLADKIASNISSKAVKRKPSDLEPGSPFKRSKGKIQPKEQQSSLENEKHIKDKDIPSTVLIDKKLKHMESKSVAGTSTTAQNKNAIAIELSVITRRETRQTLNDKNKNLYTKKDSTISNENVTQMASEPEVKMVKSKTGKRNVKHISRLTEDGDTCMAPTLSKAIEETSDVQAHIEENKSSSLTVTPSRLSLPQTRVRTAKEPAIENSSRYLRQKNINGKERPDSSNSSKENENERSSSKSRRKTNNVETLPIETEKHLTSVHLSESSSKKSKTESRKLSGIPSERSDSAQNFKKRKTSTASTSKSKSEGNGYIPCQLNSQKEKKSSTVTAAKNQDEGHDSNVTANSEEHSSDDVVVSTPKRPLRRKNEQSNISSENLSNTPHRSSPRRVAGNHRSQCQVLFTGISDAKQEAIVKILGGTIVDLPESCSVLVTDKVRRTFKFLCIMGHGKPIVSTAWLTQSKQAGKFLDPWKFLIKDQESETKFSFNLKNSLEKASKINLLSGYSIYVTSKVLPPPPEMRGIIESCGGIYLVQRPSSKWPEKSFIISCNEDKTQWSKLKKSGKPIVGAEILLLGILQQKLDIKSNTLV